MFARILLLLLLIPVVPSWSAAQGSADAVRRIEAAKERAAAGQIPASLLESKVAEGRAKGVPMERIAAAVEQRLAALERARRAMPGPQISPADLSVGADALISGVSSEILAALSSAAPADRRAVAIAVLTQLVQQGEPAERALGHVTGALKRGPEALRVLPTQVPRRGPPDGFGPPAGKGRPPGAGPGAGGPPPSVPGPGRKPDTGKPTDPGQGNGRPGGGL